MSFKQFAKSAGRGYVEGSKRAMKRGEKAGKTLAKVGRSAGNVGRKVIGESRFEPYKKRKGIYEEITKKGKKKLVKKKRKTGFEGAGTAKGIKKVKDPRTLMEQAFR